ncbi:stage III sporulation protein AF [Irregularibacter muris]|uniref:Stage III sporulation protein AF n=1 Tax=Irregularibacter muris TaxID=1796619 RepID=A0AAE3KZA7_9FIRM|nr:stage III sporulation protein AF [Irregularibacter muris]MCR1897992.1 stage III sporulation protein AF [Irregularibacter muris]
MIEILSSWVQNIIYIVIFVVFLELLFPDNFMQKYVRMVSGLLIIVVILTPITKLFSKNFNVENAISQNYVDMAQIEIKSQQEALQSHQEDLAINIYKDKITQQIKQQLSKKLEGLSIKVELEIFEDIEEDNYGGIKEVTLYLARSKEQKKDIKTIEKIEIGKNTDESQGQDSKKQDLIDKEKEKEIKEYFLDFYNVPIENISINIQENIGEEGEE